MICNNCGNQISDFAKVCPLCNVSLQSQLEPKVEPVQNCYQPPQPPQMPQAPYQQPGIQAPPASAGTAGLSSSPSASGTAGFSGTSSASGTTGFSGTSSASAATRFSPSASAGIRRSVRQCSRFRRRNQYLVDREYSGRSVVLSDIRCYRHHLRDPGE